MIVDTKYIIGKTISLSPAEYFESTRPLSISPQMYYLVFWSDFLGELITMVVRGS